jgi:hypothetical protein
MPSPIQNFSNLLHPPGLRSILSVTRFDFDEFDSRILAAHHGEITVAKAIGHVVVNRESALIPKVLERVQLGR